MQVYHADRGDKAHDPRYKQLVGKLKAGRMSLGLTQEALAARLKRHQQFVSRYEAGERRLDVVEFCDVARALSLDPAAMLSDW